MELNFLWKFSHIFYYETHSSRCYNKCNVVSCKAFAILMKFQWNINILYRFLKKLWKSRNNIFIVEGQTERWGMDMMNVTVTLWKDRQREGRLTWMLQSYLPNIVTELQTWHSSRNGCEISGIHTDRMTDISLPYVGSKQPYTPSVDWHKRFHFGNKSYYVTELPSSHYSFVTSNRTQRDLICIACIK